MVLKKYWSIYILGICSFISIQSFGQLRCDWTKNQNEHLLKVNLLNLPLKTFNLEYERTLKPQTTWGINAIYTPNRDLPFKNLITEKMDDEFGEKTINELQLNQFSVIPYMRFYLGNSSETFTKFYLSPYLKYTRYNSNLSVHYQYTYINEGLENEIFNVSIPIKANINTLSAGFAIGFQYHIFKNIFLDWKAIGHHYGILFGNGEGNPTLPLTPEVQEDIKKSLDSVNEVPFYKFENMVTANKVEIKPKGINIGFTTSFSIGYKF